MVVVCQVQNSYLPAFADWCNGSEFSGKIMGFSFS
ncbi:hypothetical protein MNBD_DELTA04-433, partial [hydrothermal vent metagenome]